MKKLIVKKQSGSALLAVMALIVMSMLLLPQIMNVASLAQRQGVDQAVQLKNAAKAAEVNQLMHVALTAPPSVTSTSPESLPLNHLPNFAKLFPNSTFTQTACSDNDPCLRRLKASDVNLCPQNRFMKTAWSTGNKTIVTLSCRNGNRPNASSPPVDADAISCDPAGSNLSNTADVRVLTCVYDKDSGGVNMAVSVWSYINLSDKFLKVQEDSF
jgi:hypothetical protein